MYKYTQRSLFALLFIGLTVFCFELYAEDLSTEHVTISANKKLQIAKYMVFTEQEDKFFWNVYADYEKEMDNVYRQKFELLKEFQQGNDGHTITDDQANEMLDRFFGLETQMMSIKQNYLPKFRSILPGRKVARFYQIDNKLDAIVNHELAIKVVLIQ